MRRFAYVIPSALCGSAQRGYKSGRNQEEGVCQRRQNSPMEREK
ncbi:MAG: hypothetical protein ACLSAF_19890 [Intestinimonas sp.]